jgi:DNA-directed RNA polymerase specialized sigma24 family protein
VTDPRQPDSPAGDSATHGRRLLEALLHIPIDGEVEARIEERELACTADRLRKLLAPLLESLQAEERLLLRLSFFRGLSIAPVAPILGRPQKELYKVRERCLRQIQLSLREAHTSSRWPAMAWICAIRKAKGFVR